MSRSHDPIQVQLSIYAYRVLKFIVIAALLALALWLWPLWNVYQVQTASGLWEATQAAWAGENSTGWLLMRLAFALALTTTTCFYLLLALWWKRSSERHHRGAQLVDGR